MFAGAQGRLQQHSQCLPGLGFPPDSVEDVLGRKEMELGFPCGGGGQLYRLQGQRHGSWCRRMWGARQRAISPDRRLKTTRWVPPVSLTEAVSWSSPKWAGLLGWLGGLQPGNSLLLFFLLLFLFFLFCLLVLIHLFEIKHICRFLN
jgi:hypothetical protein